MEQVARILKDHKLKNTSCRQDVLNFLLSNDHALSHADLELAVSDQYDRVTLYRTLKTFQEKGIIHKVLDDSGTTKYAPCHHCTTEQHHHEHIHFKCNKCGNTVCIEDINIPQIRLPEGFSIDERNILISGTCNICNKN